MFVTITQSTVVDRKQVAAGETIEASDGVARLLIGMGKAIVADATPKPQESHQAEDADLPRESVEQATGAPQRKKK